MTGPAIDVMVDGELNDAVGWGTAARARPDERVDAVVIGRSAEALVPRSAGLAGAVVATAVGRRCAGAVATCRTADGAGCGAGRDAV